MHIKKNVHKDVPQICKAGHIDFDRVECLQVISYLAEQVTIIFFNFYFSITVDIQYYFILVSGMKHSEYLS